VFTKFFQNYYLPTKFGYDKRRPHLSSLIAAGSIERREAVRLLAEPLYGEDELVGDREYICLKLKISQEEFNTLMKAPTRHYSEFSNWNRKCSALKRILDGGIKGNRSLNAHLLVRSLRIRRSDALPGA